METIDLLEEGTLLPPPKGTCEECGVAHDPNIPHNKDSLYYQYKFKKDNKRWPTWKDAMSHCEPTVIKAWKQALKEQGVEI